MRRKGFIHIIGLVAVAFFISTGLQAQEKYQLDSDNFTLKIKGTSNAHDWDMEAEDVSGELSAKVQNSLIEQFNAADIKIEAEKLESGKSIMNKKTYEALQSEEHPKIKFQLKSVEDLYSAGSSFSGKAKGVLSIAGNSRTVSIPFSGKMNGEDQFSVSGDYSLKMTDYDIDPPKAMFGTLKTGDEVTIKYDFVFKETSGMLTNKNKSNK